MLNMVIAIIIENFEQQSIKSDFVRKITDLHEEEENSWWQVQTRRIVRLMRKAKCIKKTIVKVQPNEGEEGAVIN